MDTDTLRTFITVARTQSVTLAADELYVAQSTVTNRLQSLERILDRPLFERRPHGMALADGALPMLEHAHTIVDAEQQMLLGTATQEPEGTVRVCAPESICAHRIPRFIADLGTNFPKISIHLTPSGTAESMRRLRQREVDLGLILGEQPGIDGVSSTLIGFEQVVLVGADGVAVGDRSSHRYFLLEEGCNYSDEFITTLGTTNPGQITRFGSSETARACVEARLGLSVLPEVVCADAIRDGRLAVVEQRPRVPVQVARNSLRLESSTVGIVRERLLALYGNEKQH